MEKRVIESRINSHKSGTFFLVLLLAWPALAGGFAGGTGEPNDPYQIATAEQLTSIGSDPNDLAKHFVLVADIDLDPNLPGNRVFERAVIAPDTNNTADEFQGAAFTGVFDGNGHVISNLTIKGSKCLGLFGRLEGGSHITGLGLEDVNIVGTGRYVGGLVGYSLATISACYSTGSVSGDYNVGGLAGYNSRAISACYSTGSVIGLARAGGLVGHNFVGTISACYSTGPVSNDWRVGGLVGQNDYGAVSACFWDTETSGRATSDGGTGLTTGEMQAINTFLDAGWDFLDEGANGLCEYWQMPVGGGYPVLSIFDGFVPHALQGAGAAEDPYLLETAEDLGTVWYRPMASYQLAADIDLSGIKWGAAVIPAFSGRLDGQGHRIAGLNISGGGHLGLIGYLAQGAAVFDLGLEDVNVVGTGGRVGGLVGDNSSGAIAACYSTGSVSGAYFVGGLVGDNHGTVSACYSSTGSVGEPGRVGGLGELSGVGGLVGCNGRDGTISACYSTGSVSGYHNVGGLVGWNGGVISACCSTGSGSGTYNVGGLVGYNGYGRISACYSTGSVSGDHRIGGLVGDSLVDTISACFWDTETSGQTASAGGTGLTTSEMMAVSTFLDAGWDFLGERTNGLCEYWHMPIEGGYPVLSIFDGYVPHALQGTGTAEDPYLLETAEDLGTVCYRPAASYRLTADIDLAGIEWAMAVIPAFSGRFDGQRHRIAGLNIVGGERLGLMGYLAQGAVVFDLGLEDVSVVGTGDRVGGLVGHNDGGAISACYSTGSVRGYNDVGGLAGRNYGAISACSSIGSVRGRDNVGGLVGYNRGPISACHSTRSGSRDRSVAGLVRCDAGPISACYHTGPVSGEWSVGGLVGYNDGTISACYSTRSVTGSDGVGGLVGWNDRMISACYSTGPVTSGDSAGGLVGLNYVGAAISACYSTGSVSGGRSPGGLVGDNYDGTVSACFWDTEASGWTTSAGGTGLPTRLMQAIDTFLDAGWDFAGTWCMPANDYPRLLWEDRCGE